jgi:hypothetical protein
LAVADFHRGAARNRATNSGPDAPEIGSRITSGLDHAEFKIPGQIVADVALIEEPLAQDDGSLMLKIEALTIVQ